MVKPVENGYITATFSDHIKRGQNGSFGVDIGSHFHPCKIVTPYAGLVTSALWTKSFGNRVWIKINEGERKGYYCVFAHLESIDENIEDGYPVRVGDLIGIMGNTGYSKGIHLHFEIRTSMDLNGISIHPKEIEELYDIKH